MPLIFDDLAEVHRVSGVSDAVPPGVGTPGAQAPEAGTTAATATATASADKR